MLIALLLLACSSDFSLEKVTADNGPGDTADTAAEEPAPDSAEPAETGDRAEDSAGDLDSGSEEEPTDSAEDPGEETTSDPAPEDDCEDTSDLIYVISRDDSQLYLFDPSALHFEALGRLRCDSSATPGSMAVSRDGQVFVRYSDDTVYAVDLSTFSCTRTSYSDRATGFGSFGMGYATDSTGTWRDQLYVANEDQLARLETGSWSLEDLGAMPSQSELTGNADGELWAFLPLETPAALVQLDKDDAHRLTTIRLPGFPDAGDIDTFAFAGWSGDFYLFVRVYGMGESTDVYKVTSEGDMEKVLDDVGFDVVGAGVSTCAPA